MSFFLDLYPPNLFVKDDDYKDSWQPRDPRAGQIYGLSRLLEAATTAEDCNDSRRLPGQLEVNTTAID